MAMRITTKMMQTTSLNNLNTNKTLQSKLTTQLATGKKLTRPSDDPVVAIRSLKLNASLNKVDQYYEKNTKDAESWLKLTESALGTTNTILTAMRTYIVQASNGTLETQNRLSIVENLSNLKTEIYSTGNADSAGRTIFTGYRTNMSLTIKEDDPDNWTYITEQMTNSKLDTKTFVRTGDLSEINEGNFKDKETTEFEVDSYKIARIRLSYDDLDSRFNQVSGDIEANAELSFRVNTELSKQNGKLGSEIETTDYKIFVESDASGDKIRVRTEEIGDPTKTENLEIDYSQNPPTVTGNIPAGLDLKLQLVPNSDPQQYSLVVGETATGKETSYGFTISNNTAEFNDYYETQLEISKYFKTATDDAYLYAVNNPDSIVYIAETGELLLGANIQKQLAALDPSAEIRASYEKTNWEKGDLDPVHYFYAKRNDKDTGKELIYNEDKLTDKTSDNANQIISYDIGNNQSIRVNTVASEVFTHDIGRDIDEVLSMLNEYEQILTVQDNIKKMIESGDYQAAELEKLNIQKDALTKAADNIKDKIEKTCTGLITSFDGYIKQSTLATTECGARESRLKLVQNRLGEQQTNFQELVSENEDADITELAIQLSSVELTYQAALSSISYVLKTSLLDFI